MEASGGSGGGVPGPPADLTTIDTNHEPGILEPQDWIRYCADRLDREPPPLPRRAIQLLMRGPFATALERFGAETDDFTQAGHPFAVVSSEAVPFVLAHSSKGSSAAGGIEELIALGVEQIVVIGGAGAMVDELVVGQVVVASAALRDDGVSDHYDPPGAYSYPSEPLTRRLEVEASASGLDAVTAPVWSMTAYFRQTPTRLRAFRDDGCVAVCNEAAAAFAVGRYRDVDVAAMFLIGDSIAAGVFDVSEEPEPGTVQVMIDAAVRTFAGSSRA